MRRVLRKGRSSMPCTFRRCSSLYCPVGRNRSDPGHILVSKSILPQGCFLTTPLFVSSAAIAYILRWAVKASDLRAVLSALGRIADCAVRHLCDGLASCLLAFNVALNMLQGTEVIKGGT